MPGDSSAESFSTDKVEKLQGTARSYVKWARDIERVISQDPKMAKVVAYAIHGNDNVLALFQEDEDLSDAENAERRKASDLFDERCNAFISKVMSALSPELDRRIRKHAEYSRINEEGQVLELWELIRDTIVEENNKYKAADRSMEYLGRIKQNANESLRSYGTRFMDVIDEIEILGETVSKGIQRTNFLSGMHPRFNQIDYELRKMPDLATLELETIVDRAETLYQQTKDRSQDIRWRPTERSLKRSNVVAGLKDQPKNDINNCNTCLKYKDGRLPEQQRGKDYKQRRTYVSNEEDSEARNIPLPFSLTARMDVRLAFDVVYVGDRLFNCMVVKPYNYLLGTWVDKRSAKGLLESTMYLVGKVKASNGVERIESISVDRDPLVNSEFETQLAIKLSVLLKQSVPYRHERDIERQVRTIRNRYRCVLGDIKVPITDPLRKLAWEHAVKASNFIKNKNSGDFLPFQVQHQQEVYRTPPAFGHFVIGSIGKVKSKEQPRNQVGIIVGFEENTRAVMIKFKGQRDILIRDSYRVIKDQSEGLILYEESSRDEDFGLLWMDNDQADEEDIESVEQEDLQAILKAGQDDLYGEVVDQGESILEVRRSTREPNEKKLNDFIYAMREMKVTPRTVDFEDREASWKTLERICGLVDDAAIQGELGQKAAAKIELERVWKKYGAIKPVKLDKEQPKEIIKGKLFVTEKRDASHNFTRNKGRLVARGDMRKDKPEDVFSPTVAFPTVLTLLNLILTRDYSYMVVDVESAYLNSKYGDGVYMKLDRKVAEIMVEMDDTVKDYVENDGSIYVQIVKALYGLQESAKLWYETLKKSLEVIGFRRSNYDHALYYKMVNDELILILIYVDDMIIAGSAANIKNIKGELDKVYALSASELSPKEFDYVGIKVQFDGRDKSFILSQPGMLNKVTKDVEGTMDTPCDVKLYHETDDRKVQNVTEYRSQVMEMAYLSKTRPDIKVAIGYLSTRMQEPTRGDELKVMRVKKYLNGTKHFKMRIKPIGRIQVYASADASFGPYVDGKSNTGMVLTMGFPNAPVLAKTTKQKSVANSSTAAELIAFSSTLEEVLWLVELLNELGLKQEAVEIEQDNSSTMKLIEKGPSSNGRTKWINIKQFWVSEHLTDGKINLKYVPSLDLLADGLTKPLGRKAFQEWRARILNFSNSMTSVEGV